MASDECYYPCTGNGNEICGSSRRLSVYGPKATTTTKTPTTIKTTADLITTVYETSGGVSETIPSS